ncbi:hypothetical protein EG832_19915 [bacterium]|nr:hypothetical protein [bacterium]
MMSKDTKDDPGKNIAQHQSSSPILPQGEYTDVKLSYVRHLIGKAMAASLSEATQLTLHASFDASRIIQIRKQLKEKETATGVPQATLNDCIVWAVSRTLPRHPYMNAHFLEDCIRLFSSVHLGVAMDTPRGLLVPTIINAHLKTLEEISQEVRVLSNSAQTGKIDPDLLSGATFTVTNLGALGIEMFTPIINTPQTGILGVNAVVERIRTINNALESYPSMGLSLTFDHRALDGAPAAKFLHDLCETLVGFSLDS